MLVSQPHRMHKSSGDESQPRQRRPKTVTFSAPVVVPAPVLPAPVSPPPVHEEEEELVAQLPPNSEDDQHEALAELQREKIEEEIMAKMKKERSEKQHIQYEIEKQRHELRLKTEAIQGWRGVARCSLRSLCFIWFALLLTVLFTHFVLRTMLTPSKKDLKNYTWTVFLCIGSTVIWVVLSRAISSSARRSLYAVWLLSFFASTIWFVLSTQSIEPFAVFMTIAALSFFVLSKLVFVVHEHQPLRALFVFLCVEFVAGLIAYLIVLSIGKIDKIMQEYMLYAGTAAIAYIYIHVMAIWFYLHQNKQVWLVEDTCLFAIFSPLTEAIDAFEVFGPPTCMQREIPM